MHVCGDGHCPSVTRVCMCVCVGRIPERFLIRKIKDLSKVKK